MLTEKIDCDDSSASEMSMSNIGKVLQDAERDLDNSEWPGVMGTVLHPLRDILGLPSLRFVNHYIAPVTLSLPSPIDQAAGALVGVASGAIKFTYGLLPHVPSLDEFAVQEIEKTSLPSLSLLQSRESVSESVSLLLSVLGFMFNTILDLLTNPAQKYASFINTIKMFIAFLIHTGITNEISDAFATHNAIENMMLIAKVQAPLDDDRRADVTFRTPPLTTEQMTLLLQESKRHLMYATAAYGAFQVSASESLPRPHQLHLQAAAPFTAAMAMEGPIHDGMVKLQAILKRRIAKYLGLQEKDILYMTSPGEELDVIPHFIAVDTTSKSLVLAIRGTSSFSGAFVDIDASSCKL